jgi:hypothetical protein
MRTAVPLSQSPALKNAHGVASIACPAISRPRLVETCHLACHVVQLEAAASHGELPVGAEQLEVPLTASERSCLMRGGPLSVL